MLESGTFRNERLGGGCPGGGHGARGPDGHPSPSPSPCPGPPAVALGLSGPVGRFSGSPRRGGGGGGAPHGPNGFTGSYRSVLGGGGGKKPPPPPPLPILQSDPSVASKCSDRSGSDSNQSDHSITPRHSDPNQSDPAAGFHVQPIRSPCPTNGISRSTNQIPPILPLSPPPGENKISSRPISAHHSAPSQSDTAGNPLQVAQLPPLSLAANHSRQSLRINRPTLALGQSALSTHRADPLHFRP